MAVRQNKNENEKEKKFYKKNPSNKVHLFGEIRGVQVVPLNDGSSIINLNLRTVEAFEVKTKKETKMEYRNTFHKVSVPTDSGKLIRALEAVASDIEKNKANRDNEEYKEVKHNMSVDGILVSRSHEDKEAGVTYYNDIVLAKPENIRLDAEKQEKEVRNSIEFSGNIARVDINDDAANVSVATHYAIPGGKEETAYIKTTVFANGKTKGTYEELKNGKLPKGALISVRGMMQNDNFPPKSEKAEQKAEKKEEKQNETVRFGMKVKASDVKLIALAKDKTEKAEVKTEKKADKKPAVSKKTTKKNQMKM